MAKHHAPDHPNSSPSGGEVATMLGEFHDCLFRDYLPFLNRYIFDHQEGGFLWNSTYRGEVISTSKRTWYDARGVWVYARLYTLRKADPVYLGRARQTLALLERAAPRPGDLYPWSYDRYGRDLAERPGDIYGNLFVAEAFLAYSQAASDSHYRDRARRMLLEAFALLEQPNYRYQMAYAPTDQPVEVRRVLGHWMICLRLSTSFLRLAADPDIENIARRCIHELTEVHVHRDSGLMLEVVAPLHDEQKMLWDDFVYLGHAIESLWMLMDEALRRADTALFDLAALRFEKHVEAAWDPVYGGFFHSLKSVENHRFLLDKILWAQHEALMGCLLLWRERSCCWSKAWSRKIWDYLLEHYRLSALPFRPWLIGGNRRMENLTPKGERIENYHHPRLLIAGLGYLEDIKKITE